MNCAFIGFGNAAYKFALGLRAEGVEHIFFYKHHDIPPFTGILAQHVEKSGAEYCQNYKILLESSTVIISCVVGSAALDVCRAASEYLTPKHIYADFNTTSPEVKEKLSKIVCNTGASFVDGAILGPVGALGHKVPITICGDGALAFYELMKSYGMQLTVLDGKPGQAAAVKMVRSVFQKGLMCLFLELLVAAKACGVENAVLSSIGKTFNGVTLEDMMERMVPKAVSSARRMSQEMRTVANILETMSLPSFMSEASIHAFDWFEQLQIENKKDDCSVEETICAIRNAMLKSKK